MLFLDELAEFPASVLDALRQPLEEGVVRISRAYGSTSLPARVLLVAAMNPCPCGESTSAAASCRCAEGARSRYLRGVSGPLLDRFDLRVHVDRPRPADLFSKSSEEPSAVVADRVGAARAMAAARGPKRNASIEPGELDEVAPLATPARILLAASMERGRITARGMHRLRRVAGTIADLDGVVGVVQERHVAEALALRVDVLADTSIGTP